MDWNFSFFYDTYAHDLLNLLKYISVSWEVPQGDWPQQNMKPAIHHKMYHTTDNLAL